VEIAMYSARQAACWGALPRRQRRLRRSSSVIKTAVALVVPTLGCAAALTIYLGYVLPH